MARGMVDRNAATACGWPAVVAVGRRRLSWSPRDTHLIGIAGSDADEQEAELLGFLDRLAARVALRRPRLFLADDVTHSPHLAQLRETLIKAVAPELVRICVEGLDGL